MIQLCAIAAFILIFNSIESFALIQPEPFVGLIEQTQVFHPDFSHKDFNEDDTQPDPDWSKDLSQRFSTVRIKVFPHNSKYNAPHGRDTTTDKIKISSNGNCTVFQAEKPSSADGITRDKILMTGKVFEFNTTNVEQPLWLECSEAFQVNRLDYPDNPIRYLGLAFIKKIIAANATPYLTVINVLPFESYLKGVVPSEMPAHWAIEALKAQAIAARTYALYELSTNVYSNDLNILNEQSGAQMDDTVTYQAYLGLKNMTAATNKAIDETTDQVMVHSGKVVKAYFHADSGGHTENAENVWGRYYPYIIGKPEIYPEGSVPGSNWNFTTSLKDIQNRLRSSKLIDETNSLIGLRINKEDYFLSTRPEFIVLILDNGSEKKVLAVDFAFVLRLKSPWIQILNNDTHTESITITGKGFGHGAGMNQWGARVLTDKLNKTHEDILKFYYTGVDIVQ